MKVFKKLFVIISVFIIGLFLTGCKDDPIITIKQTEVSLEVGETLTIDYTVEPVDTIIKWDMDDQTILNISEGKVTALKEGKTSIYAVIGKNKYEIKVTVLPKAETVTVTFDSDNVAEIEPVVVKKGEKVSLPNANLVKSGSVFLGWYLGEQKFDFNTAITEDITLVAKWEKVQLQFTVTFDSKGGSNVASVTLEKGAKVTKPQDPTKDGYEFLGWYLDEQEYDFTLEVTKDFTLVAMWEEDNKALVQFETFGGTEIPSQIILKGSRVLKPLTYPEKQGYAFLEWYSDSDFSTIADFTLPINVDTVFYAKYRPLPNTPYKVEHWILVDGEYVLDDTDEKTGTTDAYVQYYENEYADYALKNQDMQKIKGDGTTVVVLYYDPIVPYDYKLVYNGGNNVYQTRERMINDFLVDFNDFLLTKGIGPVTLETIDSWGNYDNLHMHEFMYSQYREKWLWLADYLGQVGSGANAGPCRLLLKYETLAEFNSKANPQVDKYAIDYEFRAFVMGKQFIKNPYYLTSNYAIASLAYGYGEAIAKYRMTSEFTNVTQRSRLSSFIYREGCSFAGWYDNPDFEGEHLHTITKGGIYYAKWNISNPVYKIVAYDPIEQLDKGGSYYLAWTIYPDDAIFRDVILTSSNPEVARITNNHSVRAENYGSAVIRFTYKYNPKVYTEFEVTVPVEDGMVVELSEDYNGTLKVGESFTITPSVYGDLTPTGTSYIISDNNIVDINKGVVTALALGDVNITVKNQEHEFTIALSVIEELSDTEILDKALQTLINTHQPIVRGLNIVHYYEPNSGRTLYYSMHENVNRYLFDDLVINNAYLLDTATYTTHGGPMSSVEFVVVHDTANPDAGASKHGNYFKNSDTVSIHYIVGDNMIFSSLPEGYIGFHGGGYENVTPETEFAWLDTGITANSNEPIIDINSAGYFTINGEDTQIAAPRGHNNEILDNSYFTDLGPAWEIFDGKYYLGKTHFNTTQTSRGVIANYGGSGNGIGIEMCVNHGSGSWMTDTWHRNAKLVADILVRHDLGLNRVKMHNTFDGKNCPCSLRKTNYWAEFMEMVEVEYLFATEFKDVKVSMVSHTPEVLDNKGLISKWPKTITAVSYTITVELNGVSKSITLSSIVPPRTSWVQLQGYYE